jgi:hypothetical protein
MVKAANTQSGRTATADPASHLDQLESLQKTVMRPINRTVLDGWLNGSSERLNFLRDSVWGSIRWSRSIGRSTGATLAAGFSLRLQSYNVAYVGTSDGPVQQTTWVDLPSPSLWDAASDDDATYVVNYFGYYAQNNGLVFGNVLSFFLVGGWTHPLESSPIGYLLPHPLGYSFGSYDGQPIVLDEATVVKHSFLALEAWSVRL